MRLVHNVIMIAFLMVSIDAYSWGTAFCSGFTGKLLFQRISGRLSLTGIVI
jgi:hypothetical protein